MLLFLDDSETNLSTNTVLKEVLIEGVFLLTSYPNGN